MTTTSAMFAMGHDTTVAITMSTCLSEAPIELLSSDAVMLDQARYDVGCTLEHLSPPPSLQNVLHIILADAHMVHLQRELLSLLRSKQCCQPIFQSSWHCTPRALRMSIQGISRARILIFFCAVFAWIRRVRESPQYF